jgi:DNA (cytosine-5)-methyltransferase 1
LLSALDFFCGCGGTTEGMRLAGFNVLLGLDLNRSALDVYKANHPNTKTIHADIKTVTADQILAPLGLAKGEIDLIACGPPCQGFSSIRTKNGPNAKPDKRNSLYLEVLRLTLAIKPKAVLLENVPQFTKGSRLSKLRNELEKAGYFVQWHVWDAQHLGLPQRRRRLVFIATLKIADNLLSQLEMRTFERVSVRKSFDKIPPQNWLNDELHNLPVKMSSSVLERIRLVPKDGGSRKSGAENGELSCHSKTNGFKDVYGRMAWNKCSPTITGGIYTASKGRFLHPEQDRCVTLREASLLQGFDFDYKFDPRVGKIKLASMIGNAMPPQIAAKYATAISALLLGKKWPK